MIQYGLNAATTLPLEQATEIRLVAAAGFDLIEFRAPKLEKFLESRSLTDLRRLLTECGLEPLSINALEQVNTRAANDLKALQDECARLASWAQALSCPYLVAVPGCLSDPMPGREIVPRTVDSLAALAAVAAPHGVRVGFEFLGFANCSVPSLRLARTIVDKLASPRVGLVIDSFHFFLSGEPRELLAELEPGQLFVLHVNDAEDLPRTRLADEHRVLPGSGIIPLGEMWATVRARQLISHASLELFRPQYWELPPEKFLPDALEAMRRVFR